MSSIRHLSKYFMAKLHSYSKFGLLSFNKRNVKHFSTYSNSDLKSSTIQKIKVPDYFSFNEHIDDNCKNAIISDMIVVNNFLDEADENELLNEVEPYMTQLKYEFNHWDDAIHGYRETERLDWYIEGNKETIDRVKHFAFPEVLVTLPLIHVLDLAEDGFIKPHIDSVRFCGNIIAGLSLLSDCVMRLVHDKEKNKVIDILLKRRSLYVMKDSARFDYSHEILSNEVSVFKGEQVKKNRRISIICRNEPEGERTK